MLLRAMLVCFWLAVVAVLGAPPPLRAAAPPVDPPGSRIVVPPDGVEPAPLFGVDLDKLQPPSDTVRYRLNGFPAPRGKLIEAIGDPVTGPPLPDPAGKLHVTVIGSPADRAAVVRDLSTSPGLARFRERLVVREYSPEHWHVAEVGFKRDGKPSVYVQREDGSVLHRQDTYPGPEGLTTALRKVDPQYDPAKDPDASQSPFSLATLTALAGKIPPIVWGLVAVGVFLFIRKDK